jgi:hypothetical protein
VQSKYRAWVAETVTETYGKCKEVTEAMVAAFPELTRVRGHYMCADWGKRAHWWLVDENGEIVDPTADQFPCKGTSEYVPWEEGAEEPTGKCMNCGGYTYGSSRACSPACAKKLEAYYGCSFS